MVFKPSFKCLKNKKINLSPANLKLETLLYQNIYTSYSHLETIYAHFEFFNLFLVSIINYLNSIDSIISRTIY